MTYTLDTLNDLLGYHMVRGVAVRTMVKDADPRRVQRAAKVNVTTARTDDDETVYGECVGNSSKRTYQIVIRPQPVGDEKPCECSCPDNRQRGREVGPCKHIVAVANIWLTGEVYPTYRYYEAKKAELENA
jgi:hypothetical protein